MLWKRDFRDITSYVSNYGSTEMAMTRKESNKGSNMPTDSVVTDLGNTYCRLAV